VSRNRTGQRGTTSTNPRLRAWVPSPDRPGAVRVRASGARRLDRGLVQEAPGTPARPPSAWATTIPGARGARPRLTRYSSASEAPANASLIMEIIWVSSASRSGVAA
jgi:hypothetical protein